MLGCAGVFGDGKRGRERERDRYISGVKEVKKKKPVKLPGVWFTQWSNGKKKVYSAERKKKKTPK